MAANKVPFLESRASAAVIATSLIIAAVGIVLPFTWLGGTLGFVPLPPAYWIPLCLILLGYAVLTHLTKTWFTRRFRVELSNRILSTVPAHQAGKAA